MFVEPVLLEHVMIELIKALILGFTVGISAALIPGPMMFATIGASLKKGWKVGPSVFVGHALVELTFVVLILIGASSFTENIPISDLAKVGGSIMLLFGLVMIKSAKEVSTKDTSISVCSLNLSSDSFPGGTITSTSSTFSSPVGIVTSALNHFSNPISAGIITSALDPLFVIWWLTAGSIILFHEYLIGIFAVVSFIFGHWMADLGFLVAVSTSFSRGDKIISQRTHIIVIYLCGGFMTVFGLWFMLNNSNFAAMI
jgi:threonine/homoserine/homoserine lactone efflux protein